MWLQRVTSVTHPDTLIEAFNLDSVGNRLGVTARFGGQTAYTHNALNEYLTVVGASGGAPPRHDVKGNLTRDERGTGYSYDLENRLVRVFADASGDGVWQTGELRYAENLSLIHI